MRTLQDVDDDLTAAYAARRAALSAQSYSLDTGQGKQSVSRASLRDIDRTIAGLLAEREEINDPGSGIVAGDLERYS